MSEITALDQFISNFLTHFPLNPSVQYSSFKNCFLLLLPPLCWNLFFINELPSNYAPNSAWDAIPYPLEFLEHSLRILVFGSTIFMTLSIKTKKQKLGLSLYFLGLMLYFSSWWVQINFPKSNWSTSLIGYAAPAYTPFIWLIGIGFVSQPAFFKQISIQKIYFIMAVLFIVVHVSHAYLAFQQI